MTSAGAPDRPNPGKTMAWYSLVMADAELGRFRRELLHQYREEIDSGRTAGFTLFASKNNPGDHTLFVPPGAVVLFERMPNWQRRLRPYSDIPNLSGSEALPVR